MRSYLISWQATAVWTLALILVAVGSRQLAAQQPTASSDTSDRGNTVENALRREAVLEFVETPLSDVVQFLSDLYGIDIYLDRTALHDIGWEASQPVTFSIKTQQLRSALNHMLRPLELDWTVRNDELVISTPEALEYRLPIAIVPVSDLILTEDRSAPDFDTLIEIITSVVAPDTWDAVGGPGAVEPFRESLVLSQSYQTLGQVQELMAAIRAIRGDQNDGQPRSHILRLDDDRNLRIRAALENSLQIEFHETPLTEVAEYLATVSNVPILIDERALDSIGLSAAEVDVTATAKQVPLSDALDRVLREHELAWQVLDEAIVLTTVEEAEYRMQINLYPVADLVQVNVPLAPLAFGAIDDADSMIEMITSVVDPDSWEEVGGPGTIEIYPYGAPMLIIAQTEAVHRKIEKVLSDLRAARERERQLVPPIDPAQAAQTYRLWAYQLYLGADGNPMMKPELVMEVIRKVTGGDHWDGEKIVLSADKNQLIVGHTQQMHAQVQQVLRDLMVWSPNSQLGPLPVVGQGGGFF